MQTRRSGVTSTPTSSWCQVTAAMAAVARTLQACWGEAGVGVMVQIWLWQQHHISCDLKANLPNLGLAGHQGRERRGYFEIG